MHVERLKRMEQALREYVAGPSDFRFNMGIWYSPWNDDHNCGTAGCAIGLALQQRLFWNDGLRGSGGAPFLRGAFLGCLAGFDAIEVLFDLSHDQARYLFSKRGKLHSQGRDAALDTANRIRALIDATQPRKKCEERELELA